MSYKRTTIYDIAKELNTTASTVSRALNNDTSIALNTRELIQKTAERLDYRQNRIAASLRSGRTKVIGVIIPSAEINFFGSVVHGIEHIARREGYNVLLFQSNEQTSYEKEGIEALLQLRVDGILASVAKETTSLAHFAAIKKRNIPLILFDRASDELGVPSVVIDDFKGAYIATEHLIQQGYQRIAHIAGQQHIKIFNDRLRGYVHALHANGLPLDDDLIQYGKISIESGRACAQQLLQIANPPDAIFAVEDFTALGAMQAIKEMGLGEPWRIGLVGFANEAFSAYISPGLSTIVQQTVKMGEESAQLFMNIVADKQKMYVPEKVILEPELIIRDSSIRK